MLVRWGQHLVIGLSLALGSLVWLWAGFPHFWDGILIGSGLLVTGYFGCEWISGVITERRWLLRLEALRASLAYLPHVERNLDPALELIGQQVAAAVVAWVPGDMGSGSDAHAVGPLRWPVSHPMVAIARSQGVLQALEDATRTGDASMTASGLRSAVAVPVRIEGQTVGVMAIGWPLPRRLTSAERRFLSAAVVVWGVAIENLRIWGRLKDEGGKRERERVARELHDGLAQTLTLLKLRADAVLVLPKERRKSRQVLDALEETRQMAMQAAYDLRGVIHDLRQRDAEARDWAQELSTSLEAWSAQAGINARLDLQHDFPELRAEGQIQVLRIIQEALTNVRKHSGARAVIVRVARESVGVVVSVTDDGCGFDPYRPSDPAHFGLRILHERAQAVNGILQVITSPGQGTEVRLVLPDRSAPDREGNRLERTGSLVE